jgi:hypothetical protein
MRKTTGPRKKGVMGRWSIFRPKVNDTKHRVQGILTDDGQRWFEAGRAQLGDLYKSIMGRPAAQVSDADTIEFLARGELGTVRYLRKAKREE